MAERMTAEEAKEYMAIRGEIRGISLLSDIEYVSHLRGRDAGRAIEQELDRLGYPLIYKEIKPMKFYPAGYAALQTIILRDVLHFSDEDFYTMGMYGPKSSIILKVMLKYFISLQSAFLHGEKMWSRYYTIGTLRVVELDEKQRFLMIRLEDFKIVRPICHVLRGYLAQITRMVTKGSVSCRERACMFDGDPYHEFLIRWE